MTAAAGGFAESATQYTLKILKKEGIAVAPDGIGALREFFDAGLQRDPENARDVYRAVVHEFVTAARDLDINEITALSFGPIKSRVCPLYPWC